MIYLSDDYIEKYQDTLGYVLARSIKSKNSFSYIQKSISYSQAFSELEQSNVTLIAFSSFEKIYDSIFYDQEDNNFTYNPYDEFGWLGFIYFHLFLHFKLTFEGLFIVFPLETALNSYHLYHEMDVSQIDLFFKEQIRYSILDIIMKHENVSTKDLSDHTGISFATINALRYGKRDIRKLEAQKLIDIAFDLKVKPETLIGPLPLKFDR